MPQFPNEYEPDSTDAKKLKIRGAASRKNQRKEVGTMKNIKSKVMTIVNTLVKQGGDPTKFCVKKNKALPFRQDLRQGKI